MIRIGCHLSIANGHLKAAETAVDIGANIFQYFSRNPQGYKRAAINHKDITACDQYMDAHDLITLVHAPYTLNLAAANAELRAQSIEMLTEDFNTLDLFGGGNYVLHPGSHTTLNRDFAIDEIIRGCNTVLDGSSGAEMLLLETMSGRGTEIGSSFEEIGKILKGIRAQDCIGVCLDTCHVFAAGYDIVTDLDGVLAEFDKHIGLDKLCAIHLNDSKHPLGSKKDRHAQIGKGMIGTEAMYRIINHPYLCELPFFLETPNDIAGYRQEIALLKEHYEEDNV